jgi:hypothetical protein
MDDWTRIQHQEAGNRIKEVEEQLGQVAEEQLPRLPEAIFRDWFLPVFAGQVTDTADVRTRLREWLSVAGNPFHEVLIIDTNNHAIRLFRVPPLFDRSVVRSIVEGRNTLGHIMRSAEQYARISPQAGRQYMVEQFKRYELFEDINEHRMQFAGRWNEILKRYGLPPLSKAAAAVKSDGGQAQAPVDDDPLLF